MGCDHSEKVKELLKRQRHSINEVSEEAESIADDISALIGDLVNVAGKDREALVEWVEYFTKPLAIGVVDLGEYDLEFVDEDEEEDEDYEEEDDCE